MFIVYKVSGRKSGNAYYGYAQADDLAQVEKSFLTGAQRSDADRADVKFLAANDDDPANLTFEMLEVFDDEMDAWMSRNDIRASSSDAVTGPTYFPGGIAARAAKEHPERVAKWKTTNVLNHRTAREAYATGELWSFKDMVSATQGVPKATVMTDLGSMTPRDFAAKYKLPV